MKKVFTLIVLLILISRLSSSAQVVQPNKSTARPPEDELPTKPTDKKITKPATPVVKVRKLKKVKEIKEPAIQYPRPQNLYLEVGGSGLALTVNYDSRFGHSRNGLGYSVGTGYFASGGNNVFTVPIVLNYLAGPRDGTSFVEIGGGTTFLNSHGDNTGKTFIFDRVTGFIGTANLGYRYQPANKGWNFRIHFTPIFYDEGVIYAGGVSVGYTFK